MQHAVDQVCRTHSVEWVSYPCSTYLNFTLARLFWKIQITIQSMVVQLGIGQFSFKKKGRTVFMLLRSTLSKQDVCVYCLNLTSRPFFAG